MKETNRGDNFFRSYQPTYPSKELIDIREIHAPLLKGMFKFAPPSNREEAKMRRRRVLDECFRLVTGLPAIDTSADIMPYIERFKTWYRPEYEFITANLTYTDQKRCLTGTIDFIFEINGSYTLVYISTASGIDAELRKYWSSILADLFHISTLNYLAIDDKMVLRLGKPLKQAHEFRPEVQRVRCERKQKGKKVLNPQVCKLTNQSA